MYRIYNRTLEINVLCLLEIGFHFDFSLDLFYNHILDEDQLRSTSAQLKDWTWVFGKTPKFSIEDNISIDNQSINLQFRENRAIIIKIESLAIL